jgi:hypothetical protein
MEKARKLGTFKNFVAGRASEATVVNVFEKHSAVLRYLGAIDPTGEVHTYLIFYPLGLVWKPQFPTGFSFSQGKMN